MRVFISWSGDQSRRIAEALHDWLPKVIQQLKPWMSSKDIRKGTRWQMEIGEKLEATDFGIVCLTPSNLEAPWVLFESGALAKKLNGSHLCTYLMGVKVVDIAEPLQSFQATHATRGDTLRLMETINESMAVEQRLGHDTLKESFELWWPKLENQLDTIAPDAAVTESPYTLEQIGKGIEELLQRARADTARSPYLGGLLGDYVMPKFEEAASNLGLGDAWTAFTTRSLAEEVERKRRLARAVREAQGSKNPEQRGLLGLPEEENRQG